LKIIEKNLIGMYFTSFQEKKGKKYIYLQGQIMGRFNNYLIIDLFSWLDGSYVYSQLIDIDHISKSILFNNKEFMKDWYQQHRDDYKDGIECWDED